MYGTLKFKKNIREFVNSYSTYQTYHGGSFFLTFQISEFLSAFTCPKLTIETLEQGVKYVQSYMPMASF